MWVSRRRKRQLKAELINQKEAVTLTDLMERCEVTGMVQP